MRAPYAISITSRVVRRARRRYGVTVYNHRQWQSRCRPIYASRRKLRPVNVRQADTLVQHITVTRPTADLRADARVVEQIGLQRFGSGVSYNFLFNMRAGDCAVGMPLDAKGTHTVNLKGVPGFSYDQNHAARAFAVVGTDQPLTQLSPRAAEAMARVFAAMMDCKALTSTPDYEPHSRFASKDCPCDPTRDRMAAIEKRAHALRKMKRRDIPDLSEFTAAS